jgi:predicted nucleic acid-binding protein
MIYVDTSCLLTVLFLEPLSASVASGIQEESSVVVSALTELETLVQLKAAWTGGSLTLTQWRQAEAKFSFLRSQPPFEFRPLPARILLTALRQHRNSGNVHCRSLDRLHLAAMEELEISRLMTHDESQARAALEAGFQVVRPGRD